MYDIIIIGGGPAGYEAAAHASSLKLKTLLIEAAELGGTCLNRGCIPTKCFCRSAEAAMEIQAAPSFGVIPPAGKPTIDMPYIVRRKDEVVKMLRSGVDAAVASADVIHGKARFSGPREIEVNSQRYTAPVILIATGSAPATLPIPGASYCLDSTSILDLDLLPESLVIIGGGVIGMEFASIFNALGTRVTVVEYCREILAGFDRDIAKRLRSLLTRRGVTFHVGASAKSVELNVDNLWQVNFESKGKEQNVAAQRVLMAVGRRPVVPEGFEKFGGALLPRGFIAVDNNFLTSLPGVYAVGDCNGLCMLAHAATAQALSVIDREFLATAENTPSQNSPGTSGISNTPGTSFPRDTLFPIPAVVFTVPEIASTGLTEELAKERGIPFRSIRIPLSANGKALTMSPANPPASIAPAANEVSPDAPTANEISPDSSEASPLTIAPADGMIKILIEEVPGEKILGCHIMGAHASDLIMEASLAISAGLPASSILRAIHPHPTLSELLPTAISRLK